MVPIAGSISFTGHHCFCWGKLVGECGAETKNACRRACLDVLRF